MLSGGGSGGPFIGGSWLHVGPWIRGNVKSHPSNQTDLDKWWRLILKGGGALWSCQVGQGRSADLQVRSADPLGPILRGCISFVLDGGLWPSGVNFVANGHELLVIMCPNWSVF